MVSLWISFSGGTTRSCQAHEECKKQEIGVICIFILIVNPGFMVYLQHVDVHG